MPNSWPLEGVDASVCDWSRRVLGLLTLRVDNLGCRKQAGSGGLRHHQLHYRLPLRTRPWRTVGWLNSYADEQRIALLGNAADIALLELQGLRERCARAHRLRVWCHLDGGAGQQRIGR